MVHINRVVNGISDTTHYCTACLDQVEIPVEIKSAARSFDERQRKTVLDNKIQQIERALGPKLEILIRDNPRFPRGTYDLVLKSLFYALLKQGNRPQTCGRHVTAVELVDACLVCAHETWGTSAKSHLKSLGIETASDVGDVAFLLVENGFLGKQANDSREDFNGLSFPLDD